MHVPQFVSEQGRETDGHFLLITPRPARSVYDGCCEMATIGKPSAANVVWQQEKINNKILKEITILTWTCGVAFALPLIRPVSLR
jgi:hypothetical protein